MDNFRVHYSGACFERGDSPEQVERRVHDKVASTGELLGIEATALHPDEKEYSEGNYVVSFEGEIEVQAETQVKAENQAYDQLSHLGQITVVTFKKEEEWVRQELICPDNINMNPTKLFRGHIRYSNNRKVCSPDMDSSYSHNIRDSHDFHNMGSSYSHNIRDSHDFHNIRKMDIHNKMGMAPHYNKEQEYIPRTPSPKEAKLLK